MKQSKAPARLSKTAIKTQIAKVDNFNRYLLSAFFVLVSHFAVAGATKHIDMSIPPQQDFYQHANGRWKPGGGNSGVNDEIKERIRLKIDGCLNNILTGKRDIDTKDSEPNLELGGDMKEPTIKLYTSLINPDDDKMKLSIRREFLLIDKITKTSDIPAILGHLNSIGVSAFVNLQVSGSKSNNQYMETAYIVPGSSIKSANNSGYVTEEYIKNLFKMSGIPLVDKPIVKIADESKAAEKILTIQGMEQKIANNFLEQYRSNEFIAKYFPQRKTSNSFVLFPAGNVSKEMQPWMDYLYTAELDEKKQFVKYDPLYFTALNKYFTSLNDLFSPINLSDLKIYLKFRFLNKYRAALFDRSSSNSAIIKQRAFQQLRNSFSYELPALCYSDYLTSNIEAIHQLIFNIQFAYDTSIESIYWMSDNAKLNAHKMVTDIQVELANSTEFKIKYTASDFSDDDPIANLKLINSYHYDQLLINRIGKISNENTEDLGWSQSDLYHGAHYNTETHKILIPLHYLLPPYFQTKGAPLQNNALNYSGLGFIIGHELAHSLEIERLTNDPEEIKRFDEIRDKLKKHLVLYDQGGDLTIQENIADILGLKMAAKAYKNSLNGNPVPLFIFNDIKLPNGKNLQLNGYQLFDYNFAEIWRKEQTPNPWTSHSLSKHRVNSTLMLDDVYNKEFEPKPGDKMYLAPDQRIRIW